MATDEQNGADAKPGKVLLVEDTLVQRLAIAALLEKHAYEVEVAADGAEAVHLLESMRDMPQIILTDIGMPRMNGINLCRHVKNNPRTKHLPVIMLTSFDDDRNHRSALEAGAADFVIKPVSEQELIFRLTGALASGSVDSAPEQRWHRDIFEAIADAVLVTDGGDRYIDANPAASELLGYTHDELLQLESKGLTLQSPGWLETQRLRVKNLGAWRGRSQIRHKNGAPILVEAHMSVTTVDGEPVYVSVLRAVA